MAAQYIPKKDNAAGRLWHLLDAALKLVGGQTHQQLTKAFEVQTPDSIGLVRSLLTAVEALDETEARIRRIPGEDYDLYLHTFPKIKGALIAGMQNYDFNQWKNQLNAETIKPLVFCANLLTKHYGEAELQKEELGKILKQVDDLYESTKASSLDRNVRDRILESLEGIRNAIDGYQIKGIHALAKALSTATGEIALHKAELLQAKNGKDGNLIEGLWGVMISVYAVILTATKSQPLLPQHFPLSLHAPEQDQD